MSRKSKKRQGKTNAAATENKPSLPAPMPAQGAQPLPVAIGPMDEPAWRRREIITVCAVLAAIVWIVFGQTAGHGFVNYDDDAYAYENPHILKGLSLGGIRWAFTHVVADNWHPLTLLTLMIDSQIYGSWAGGFHITNVLLHTAAVILLFVVLARMTGALWPSAFVAAVFAIHPLHVESVAWIAERKDVLSALFFMLTLGAYLRYVRMAPSLARYLLVVLCFALGLMSKPTLVTLPFLLLLLDYWPLRRFQAPSLGNVLVEKIPLLALSAASCLATLLAAASDVKNGEVTALSARVANAIISWVAYIGQMIYPADLAPFYPFPKALPFWETAMATAVLISITSVVVLRRKKEPWLLVGWFWYLGTLVPMIGIIAPNGRAHADRYTYISQIGLCLALTWAVTQCRFPRPGSHRRLVHGIAAAAVIAELMFCAHAQTSYWRDSKTLWTHALGVTKGNAVAHNNLGIVLFQQGRTEDAMAQYQDALQIYPKYAQAHDNLGTALLRQGRTAEAIDQYREASEIEPADPKIRNNFGNALTRQGRVQEAINQYNEALRIDPGDAEAHYNLGNALFQEGSVGEAIGQYREALRINPNYAEAHDNLGLSLARQGKRQEAIAEYHVALRINPGNAEAHYNLGNALTQEGSTKEAIDEYREALRINPALVAAQRNLGITLFQAGSFSEAIAVTQLALERQPANLGTQTNLAWMLATAPQQSLRNGARAVQLATQASDATGGNNPNVLHSLAAAYAETGRFAEALQTAHKALQLAEAGSDTGLAAELRREVKLYESGHRFEEAR